VRGYDEWVASVLDVVPPRLMLLSLFLVTALASALWYSYPAWLRLRVRLPRWRRRPRTPRPARAAWNWRRLVTWLMFWRRVRRRRRTAPAAAPPVIDTPASPVQDLTLADRLAAEGRYAEAIRQRLRDTVADLTRAGIVEPQPGWTAAELSAIAAASRPPLGPALGGATELFSQVWYGRLDARADDDERMRGLTGQVRSAL
jgi:hypothetical protein